MSYQLMKEAMEKNRRIAELEAALRDLLDATRHYPYTPKGVIERAVSALHSDKR